MLLCVFLSRLQKPENSDEESDGIGTRYAATQLGMACLASSLSPDEGLRTLVELRQARKCFVLENELHLVYLVVPIYAAVSWPNLDWMAFLTLWEALPADMKRVGELVGVEERFLVRAMRGTIGKTERQVLLHFWIFFMCFLEGLFFQVRQLAVHQRFYTALALHDLVNEVPLTTVSQKYGSTKGTIQLLSMGTMCKMFFVCRDASKSSASCFNFRWNGHRVLQQARVVQFRTSLRTVSGKVI